MRVGGGIYTKAADVGADLVGKIEANIPEDDPRNAATIADNVGDNVGDCAGMAADIFESYEVTIVAAMILGYAAFGHKGVIFPLLVRAIGVIGSIISTYSVRAGDTGDVKEAMQAVNSGFRLGSVISVVGFLLLGLSTCNFDRPYIVNQAVERGLSGNTAFQTSWASDKDHRCSNRATCNARPREAVERRSRTRPRLEQELTTTHAGRRLEAPGEDDKDETARRTSLEDTYPSRPSKSCRSRRAGHAAGLHLPRRHHPGHRPELLHGILDQHRIQPGQVAGQELAAPATPPTSSRASPSATKAPSGRSSSSPRPSSARCSFTHGTNPIFVAYGVAMCGIGMLTLTGNTISMDVFGPVADNANGIGEMGYNRDTQQPASCSRATPDYMPPRGIQARPANPGRPRAVGNTTKAITKGIAIGSAVIAAVSLFASFIAVMATGSEEKHQPADHGRVQRRRPPS